MDEEVLLKYSNGKIEHETIDSPDIRFVKVPAMIEGRFVEITFEDTETKWLNYRVFKEIERRWMNSRSL